MLSTIVISGLATLVLVVVAMNFATPEKNLERKIEHRYTIADPQFRREMSVMLGPSIAAGNRVSALQNGDEIFPAMLEAIRAARTSVTFETYIYWSGEIGEAFAEALADRARAGIPVNVTIDWVGSIRMDQALLERMEDAGVQLQRYRPLHWYNLGRMNNRTHRKLLVVDGRIGFTGGVGIADQWQGRARSPEVSRATVTGSRAGGGRCGRRPTAGRWRPVQGGRRAGPPPAGPGRRGPRWWGHGRGRTPRDPAGPPADRPR